MRQLSLIETIDSLLQQQDMLPVKLAEMSGLSKATISHILSGTTKDPGVRTLAKIAIAFNVEPRIMYDAHLRYTLQIESNYVQGVKRVGFGPIVNIDDLRRQPKKMQQAFLGYLQTVLAVA